MTRIFVDQPLEPGTSLTLDGQAFTHAVKVLRLRPGDALRLFNGDGRELDARLESVARAQATLALGTVHRPETESPLRLRLLQAVAKGERMDWALQKATECGVWQIQPVLTARGNVQLDARRWQKKHTHWQGVVRAACEQSGRVRVPSVAEPVALAEALQATAPDEDSAALRLLLHPDGAPLSALCPARPAAPSLVEVLVGPEGGFNDQEVAAAVDAGFRNWRIGPRVLRTETAPVAALTLLQARFGDFAPS